MKTFVIENGSNQIQEYSSEQDLLSDSRAGRFSSKTDLAALAATYSMSRLTDIWNRLPGVAPVKRFANRKMGIQRIWCALMTEELSDATKVVSEALEVPSMEAPQHPGLAKLEPDKEQSPTLTQESLHGPGFGPVAGRTVQQPTFEKSGDTDATNVKVSRQGSKTAMVLELMKRSDGVMSKELVSSTGWQPHSIRGFISGTLRKKMGLTIVVTRGENGQRCYFIPT